MFVVFDFCFQITAEARAMFLNVYTEVLGIVGGEENMAPPKEIVWLNGAPGAGAARPLAGRRFLTNLLAA